MTASNVNSLLVESSQEILEKINLDPELYNRFIFVSDLEYVNKFYKKKYLTNEEMIADFMASKEIQTLTIMFDAEFYLKENPDVAEAGMNPFYHYFLYGFKEYRNFHPLFDLKFYKQINLDVSPLEDYLLGDVGKRSPVNLLIDEAYYYGRYKVVTRSVFEDYLKNCKERNPSVYFNTAFYIQVNGIKQNPLSEFILAGYKGSSHPLIVKMSPIPAAKNEKDLNIIFNPLFDEQFYLAKYPGVDSVGAFRHYVIFGESEGRDPNGQISVDALKVTISEHKYSDTWLESLSWGIRDISELQTIDTNPLVSIVILNWNKSLLTLHCVVSIFQNSGIPLEILLIDNGSDPSDFVKLSPLRMIDNVRILRLGINRYFGEANNIGVENSRSDVILFLNNDAFLWKGALDVLYEELQSRTADAVGPMFLFPDGRLQEAGGNLSPCGQNVQIGKGLSRDLSVFNFPKYVNHISAACFLMRRSDFLHLGGFDYRYEPAYFEDSDLTAKMCLNGLKIKYVPEAKVTHIENATSKDQRLNLDFNKLIATNRLKFVERWSDYLSRGVTESVKKEYEVCNKFNKRESTGVKIILFSPYNLSPGGGERYLLTIAETYLEDGHDVFFCAPELYSNLRLMNVGKDLNIQLDGIKFILLNEALSLAFDFCIVMSNELSPTIRGLAKYNVYHCQFPFPMSDSHVANYLDNLLTYDVVVVNSEFTKREFLKQSKMLGFSCPHVEIISPPVQVPSIKFNPFINKSNIIEFNIISIGRFISDGHCKNQDLLIEAVKQLNKISTTKFNLTLVGALGASDEDRTYFQKIKNLTSNHNEIKLQVNSSRTQLEHLLKNAHFYWHGAGLDRDLDTEPHVFEHFGIAPVEAMSFGIVPIVYQYGGPAEVLGSIFKEPNRYLCGSIMDFVDKTLALSKDLGELSKISKIVSREADRYSEENFKVKIKSILKC